MTVDSPEKPRPEYHIEEFMRSIGIEPDEDEHLEDTPRRIAEAYQDDLFSGLGKDPKRHLETDFDDDGTSESQESGMVLVDNIEVKSMCAHHFLPVEGVAHVGYVPRNKVVGLSKLSRVTEEYARRPQVQERLTNQVADAIRDTINPKAVFVCIIATHGCMSCRGVREPDSATRTTAVRGGAGRDLERKFYDLLSLESV